MTNDIKTNPLYLIEEEIDLAKNNKRYLLEDKLLNSMSVEELKELSKDISDWWTLEKKGIFRSKKLFTKSR